MINAGTYKNDTCADFVADMLAAGFEVEHYHGRFHWQGPAVRVDCREDVMSETEVKCQWDNMGMGFIVYPIVGGEPSHPIEVT